MNALPSSQWQLIAHLEKSGALSSPEIKNALNKVNRKGFVPSAIKEYAYSDEALPVANNQTISQPSTVVFMLELLGAKIGHKVLDVGAGTGWVSCLLGEIVGKEGKVYAFEVNRGMGEVGFKNVEKHSCDNVLFRITDAMEYWDTYARYDRIHVAAAFEKIPDDLLKQLKVGGILVAPTQDGYIWKITRKKEDVFVRKHYYGFVFVPFIGE